MKCPNCNETLLMTQRNSIEIDYCPACRGVWLDKGELDKMLEFAAQQAVPPAGYPAYDTKPDHNDYRNKHPQQQGRHKPYKKKSFLGDLFDFD